MLKSVYNSLKSANLPILATVGFKLVKEVSLSTPNLVLEFPPTSVVSLVL